MQLELSENVTFYTNVQTLRKYWTDYDIKKLREPYDKNEYVVYSLVIVACVHNVRLEFTAGKSFPRLQP